MGTEVRLGQKEKGKLRVKARESKPQASISQSLCIQSREASRPSIECWSWLALMLSIGAGPLA